MQEQTMHPSQAQALALFKQMVLIRRFEEKSAELYSEGKIRGFLHLYVGQEAVAVGAISAVREDDPVFSHYREHAHALVRGVPTEKIMAEMFGKKEGCSRGRGGSMHLFDVSRNFYGGNAIVAGGIPMACGMALADQILGRNRVTLCFFGDGAVAEGAFHESMNLAALWDLPVLFCCENNQYAMGTSLRREHSQTNLSIKAGGYRMRSLQVNGMDVQEVYKNVLEASEQVRCTRKPCFIEFLTYRFRAHSMYDPELYRSREEVSLWKKKDPLLLLQSQLGLGLAELKEIEHQADLRILQAIDYAEKADLESIEDLKAL